MAQTDTSFTRRTGVPPQAEERSVSELMQQLTEQTTRLAQKEIELAKAEMAVKGKRLGIGAGAFSAAGLIALFALGAATAAAILGLATALEGWLAALIVRGRLPGARRGAGPRRAAPKFRPRRRPCRSRLPKASRKTWS